MPAKITIVNEKGEKLEAETEGYLLIYANGPKMELAGSINLKLFTPLIALAATYLSEKLKELGK